MDTPSGHFEIVVVDTGAAGPENESAAAAHDALYLCRSNDGVSAARNQGARVASGSLLLFVDDDIVVEPSNLRRHEFIHQANERCLVSGHWDFDPALRRELERTPL